MPTNPSLMFGRITPASTAVQPPVNVMCCGGMDTGAGPGTLNVVKQVVRSMRRPFVSRPDAAARPARLEYTTPPYLNGAVFVPQSKPSLLKSLRQSFTVDPKSQIWPPDTATHRLFLTIDRRRCASLQQIILLHMTIVLWAMTERSVVLNLNGASMKPTS